MAWTKTIAQETAPTVLTSAATCAIVLVLEYD